MHAQELTQCHYIDQSTISSRVEQLQRDAPNFNLSELDDEELSIYDNLLDVETLRDYARRKKDEGQRRPKSTVSACRFSPPMLAAPPHFQ